MFKYYLKYAWRNLKKNKIYSFLNIIGLALGLTCFTLIALWINDEMSYDKFNSNYNRIFRLTSKEKTETGTVETAVSSAPMANALRNDYPEVVNTVRVDRHEEIITYNHQQYLQDGILLTDPSFFDVFSYQLTEGNKTTALNEPFSVILTESSAKKYFGDSDPLGQSLLINILDSTGYGALYKVTGITPDPPQNAHFTFSMLVSFKTIEVVNPRVLTKDGWGNARYYTYLLLKKGIDYKAFSKKISHFYKIYIGDLYPIWKPIYSYQLQPLSNIHLCSNLQYEIVPNGNIDQIYIFFVIGLFILLIAGINYVNLATASSAKRAKEISIKKTVGAQKKQLILQFLSESVFTAVIALLLSFLFSFLLLPFFYDITGKELYLFSSLSMLGLLLGIAVFLGILSGIYPAMIISGFKPALVLKGSFKSGDKGILLRKTLVISQFVITIILISGIVIIYSQMSFIKHRDLGYNKDGLVTLRVNGNTDVITGFNAFKNDLETSPLISGVTTSNSIPVGSLGRGGAETVDVTGAPLQVTTARLRTDADYLSVYGIKLIAGRNFTPQNNDSIQEVIINERAIETFGWQSNESAIGKPFTIGNQKGIIVGVTNNFNFASLEKNIEPLAIYSLDQRFSRITLKANVKNVSQIITFIEKTWNKHFPSVLFDFSFLDKQIDAQYQAEKRFSKIFLCFSILSLFIACLGLYGLIAYTISQKTKEIGIRKVLGAGVNGIATMLSQSFIKLILLAFLFAVPVAWIIMTKWLEGFAYRTTISWWMFATAGSLVILIALMTVSFQAIKAAIANPIKSLRTE